MTVFNTNLYATWEEAILIASYTSVPVTALTGGIAIASGGDHACALISGGTVQCWGKNNNGELGNSSITGSSIPVNVMNSTNSGQLAGVLSVVTGFSHTCSLIGAGTVQCWGANDSGQLAMATTTATFSSTPVSIAGLSGPVTALAGGGNHTCALISGGTVQCWGYNPYGQLGNNSFTNSSVPVSVAGLSGPITALAGGGNHTCALISGGTVQCWGYNHYVQLGTGNTTSASTPLLVTGLGVVSAIAAGENHTCALISDGTVRCWGYDSYGQLGNGNTVNSATQIRVALYNGSSLNPAWTFIDGNGINGINNDITKYASHPQLAVFNSKLYATWQEYNGAAEQIRVSVNNGTDIAPLWTLVDGGGLNNDPAHNAGLPHLTVFSNKLYASWEEFNGNSLQVRVKVYQAGIWSPVDGNGIIGRSPRLATDLSGTKLYLTWQEFNGTATQVRMSVYNGKDTYPSWLSVDGVIKIPNGTSSCSPSTNCPVFSSGGISGPAGIATDSTGNVWVANSSNNSVTKISGAALSDCSSGCSTYINGGISGPAGVATDSTGNVWVANAGNNSVTKIPGGAADCSACLNFTGSGINGPAGIATDISGNVWIANKVNYTVTKIPNGAVDCSACLNYTGGGISGPAEIVTDSTGNVWVANNSNSVTKISVGAAVNCSPGCTNFAFAGFSGVAGIATDATGNVWVANAGNNSVTKIPNGAADCSACLNFTGSGINGPAGIATDISGNVWIANKVNYTVTKIPNGAVDCSACLNYTGSGISGPAGIVTDSAGNVWVANNNNSVTKISVGAAIDCSLRCIKYTGGGTRQSGMTVDGSGNVWVATQGSIGYNGINENPLKNANSPQLAFVGAKLYATWEEYNSNAIQIRSAVYNGMDTAPVWTFLDGNGSNGVNWDPLKNAHDPQLTLSGSDFYATWQEFNGTATQIRLARYNGNDLAPSWTFVDGNGAGGLNYDSGKSADHPQMTVFGSKLYLSWEEYNFVSQIRIAAGP